MRRKPLLPSGTDLTNAVRLVLSDYEGFLAAPPEGGAGDSKAFAARHTAARGALTHLEQIMKVAAEAGDAAGVQACGEALTTARQAIAALKETNPDDDAPRDNGGG